MQLTLMMPGLILPAEVRHDTLFDLQAPVLSTFAGRATRRLVATGWLAENFGIDVPLPTAALRRLATRKVDADDTLSAHAICLDPAHLRITREGITLDDPSLLNLSKDESAALIASIAPIFADWGKLEASTTAEWTLALQAPWQLETLALPDAIGAPVNANLPSGENGRAWRQRLNDAQITLHSHPVNQKREQSGLPTINALWAWGYGSIKNKSESGFKKIFSNNNIHIGIAKLTGVEHWALPENCPATDSNTLIYLPQLLTPANTLDAMAWRSALLELEQNWIAPALQQLRNGFCRKLEIVTHCNAGDISFSLTRAAYWRFWRRPLPLEQLQ